MKYLISIIILFVFSIATIKASNKDKKATDKPAKWKLVWEDNFEKEGLPNAEIWSFEEGYIRNKEAQYYTKKRSENARIKNGNLIIEARKDNWKDNKITSASIHTHGKKSILYGKVEVRAKLPTGVGTWPAIWMLGDSFKEGTGWPACGEIDIMENVGYDPHIIHGNVHTKAYNHVIGTNKGNKITVEKPYEDFHVYTIEWFKDRIDFFIDGKAYFQFKNENSGMETWPFEKAHYLLINLAIGGSWGGKEGIDESIFPQKYYIDYVKVYKQIN